MGKFVENLGVRGDLVFCHQDKNGKILEQGEETNLIVTVGKNYLAALLAGNASTEMSHVAIGSSSQAAVSTDTALIGSPELARLSAVVTQGTGADSNKVSFALTFGAGVGTGDIAEAGIFDSSSSGIMLSRIVFDQVKPKGPTDTFSITWTITYPL